MREDIHFLKNLQEQMQYEDEHDNDIQASPRFWVVGDYKWILAHEDSAERYSVYLPECAEVYEVNYLIESEQEDGELSPEALEEIKEIECLYSALEWIKRYVDEDAYLIPEEETHFIVPDTMFLTKEEAKRHIELNRHHYTSKVHTYAMTAWRAPKVERLVKILNEFDWERVILDEV